MFLNLRDRKLSIDNFRFRDSTVVTIDNIVEYLVTERVIAVLSVPVRPGFALDLSEHQREIIFKYLEGVDE